MAHFQLQFGKVAEVNGMVGGKGVTEDIRHPVLEAGAATEGTPEFRCVFQRGLLLPLANTFILDSAQGDDAPAARFGGQRSDGDRLLETEKMVQPSSTYKEIDADHGRIEERFYKIYRDLSFVTAAWNWENLSALVVVESRRYDKKKQIRSEQKRCYITNLLRGKSRTIAQAIRSHWSVESMHWTMDVVFGEDAGRKRRRNAAENFSRLIKVVMSILRNHMKKIGGSKSMARMRKQAAWNTDALEEILFQVFPSDTPEAVCQ